MAEALAAIGIIASVGQLADYGCKLSVKLFAFSQAVASADRSIEEISKDVSSTSSVLKELQDTLQQDDETKLYSHQAVLTAEEVVKDCLKVFKELDAALADSMSKLGLLEGMKKRRNKATAILERLKWPFVQSKMELLRSNLDRLKDSLSLMLQVLIYARTISQSKTRDDSENLQRALIEALARSEKESKRKYQNLRKDIEDEPDHKAPNEHSFHEEPLPAYDQVSAVQLPSHNFRSPRVSPSDGDRSEKVDDEFAYNADQSEAPNIPAEVIVFCDLITDLTEKVSNNAHVFDGEISRALHAGIQNLNNSVTDQIQRRYGPDIWVQAQMEAVKRLLVGSQMKSGRIPPSRDARIEQEFNTGFLRRRGNRKAISKTKVRPGGGARVGSIYDTDQTEFSVLKDVQLEPKAPPVVIDEEKQVRLEPFFASEQDILEDFDFDAFLPNPHYGNHSTEDPWVPTYHVPGQGSMYEPGHLEIEMTPQAEVVSKAKAKIPLAAGASPPPVTEIPLCPENRRKRGKTKSASGRVYSSTSEDSSLTRPKEAIASEADSDGENAKRVNRIEFERERQDSESLGEFGLPLGFDLVPDRSAVASFGSSKYSQAEHGPIQVLEAGDNLLESAETEETGSDDEKVDDIPTVDDLLLKFTTLSVEQLRSTGSSCITEG